MLAFLSIAAAPALAQNQQPAPQSFAVPAISPFQGLATVLRNPNNPPPAPPPTQTSGGPLPTAIPPNTVGMNPGREVQAR